MCSASLCKLPIIFVFTRQISYTVRIPKAHLQFYYFKLHQDKRLANSRRFPVRYRLHRDRSTKYGLLTRNCERHFVNFDIILLDSSDTPPAFYTSSARCVKHAPRKQRLVPGALEEIVRTVPSPAEAWYNSRRLQGVVVLHLVTVPVGHAAVNGSRPRLTVESELPVVVVDELRQVGRLVVIVEVHRDVRRGRMALQAREAR